MPFGNMSDDDMVAIISYSRAGAGEEPGAAQRVDADGQGDQERGVGGEARTTINPPHTAPAQVVTEAGRIPRLLNVANCVGCHTPRDPNTFVATGPEFSGGFEMEPAALRRRSHPLVPNAEHHAGARQRADEVPRP